MTPIFTDSSWNFDQIKAISQEIEAIGVDEMGMNPYPWQLEVCTFDQMIDVHSGNALPNMYQHWSFGKRYMAFSKAYQRGQQSLAYETVINSNPSIIYIMEDNSAAMQALVIAHAGIGHSHVFKNNYLFKDNTDASAIIDYLEFARNYIRKCEDTHGIGLVERILDACHALMWSSMAPLGSPKLGLKEEQKRFTARQQAADSAYDELWTTVPSSKPNAETEKMPEREAPRLPEHNLLYWIEKQSPILPPWAKEIVRIVRKLAQFYYPSAQCSVVHESAAVYSHMYIMRRLLEKNLITEGAYVESLASSANVVFQAGYNHPWGFPGFNIYTVGWNIAQDIERVCLNPTEEDQRWFPDWAGNQLPLPTLRYAWENFRDESFIRQFLSPKVMRDMRLFRLHDNYTDPYYVVDAIHDEEGFRQIRNSLADNYLPENHFPDIEVTAVQSKRELELTHYTSKSWLLEDKNAKQVLNLIQSLWGHEVHLAQRIRS